MTKVFSPHCAARIAVLYPPGPLPIIARSYFANCPPRREIWLALKYRDSILSAVHGGRNSRGFGVGQALLPVRVNCSEPIRDRQECLSYSGLIVNVPLPA